MKCCKAIYRKLTLKEKKKIKSLAISKIVHLAIITKNPNIVIAELKQIKKKLCVG